MTKLSSQAQAVRDSLPDCLDLEDNDIVAAKVIRAVGERLSMNGAPPWYLEGPRWVQERAIAWARRWLLAIADELENAE